MDSFTYMVSGNQHQVLALRSYNLESSPQNGKDQELASLVSVDKYLKKPHAEVRIGFVNSKVSLIPNRLFNEGQKKAYLQKLIPLDGELEIRVDDLGNFAAKNVYALEKGLFDWSRRYFPGSKVFHASTALLLGLHHLVTPEQGQQVFVHVRPGEVQMVVLNGADLLFINSFTYQSAKDFIYYLLLIFDQFGLSTDAVPVWLSGQLLEDSEIYRLVYRYVRQVKFLKLPAFFQRGPKLSRQPGYFYFDLMSLAFCH